MKNMKKVVAMLLVGVMVLGLTGCIKSFDATAYVQAELDLLTRHDVEQYEKTLGVSKEKAEEIYEEIIDEMNIKENILNDVDVSDEIEQGYEDWMLSVLSKTKYTVLEAEEVEDGYVVVVEVQPIKAMEGMTAELTTKTQDYMSQIFSDVANGGEVPSDEQINDEVFKMMLEILNGILENVTYDETVSVETKILKDDDGQFEIDEASFEELGSKLIAITDSTQTEEVTE